MIAVAVPRIRTGGFRLIEVPMYLPPVNDVPLSGSSDLGTDLRAFLKVCGDQIVLCL
jgi:hypothetical protein